MKEEIETLQNDIQKVESNNNEMEYYIKTSDIIFDYYDITEGKYYNENTFCSENNTQDIKNKESELDDNSEIKNSEEDTNSNKKRTASSRLIELNELSKKHRKVKKLLKKEILLTNLLTNHIQYFHFFQMIKIQILINLLNQ